MGNRKHRPLCNPNSDQGDTTLFGIGDTSVSTVTDLFSSLMGHLTEQAPLSFEAAEEGKSRELAFGLLYNSNKLPHSIGDIDGDSNPSQKSKHNVLVEGADQVQFGIFYF